MSERRSNARWTDSSTLIEPGLARAVRRLSYHGFIHRSSTTAEVRGFLARLRSRNSWTSALPTGTRPVWFVLPEGPSERSGEARSDPRSAAGLDGDRTPVRASADRRSGTGRLRSHQGSLDLGVATGS